MKAGTYTPPKGVAKDAAATEAYVEALSDARLVASGKYACTLSAQKASKGAFVDLLLKNSGTEKAVKPLLPLIWDEATSLICPK